MYSNNPLRQHGFTLAELATVMVIIGLLLGGILTVLPQQMEHQRFLQMQKALTDIADALMGYALSHPGIVTARSGHLPCPDSPEAVAPNVPGDGVEDIITISNCDTSGDPRCGDSNNDNIVGTGDAPSQKVCASQEGWLPTATLGVSSSDAWGNRFRYRVDAKFSNHSTGLTIGLSSVGNLRVCSDAACTTPVASNLPVVILSHGPNAAGARNSGFTLNAPPAAAQIDELQNINGRNAADTADVTCPIDPTAPTGACTFVSHDRHEAGGAGGAFDDQVGWLPTNLLFNRLVATGKLP